LLKDCIRLKTLYLLLVTKRRKNDSTAHTPYQAKPSPIIITLKKRRLNEAGKAIEATFPHFEEKRKSDEEDKERKAPLF